MKYIRSFETLSMKDVESVGGKNASLGQMIQQLSGAGIVVPTGFAVTAQGYWHVINENKLLEKLKEILSQLPDEHDIATLKKVGAQARALIESATMPPDLAQEIVEAYQALSKKYNVAQCDVAVRSSATAEDSPQASFAGQQETYLHVTGAQELLNYCLKSMASLFTDRAIVYRINHNFDHLKMALSVGVQKMIRSDLACSGVLFTLDTETGFDKVIVINASYGLGETIVQGRVIPDEFFVHKPTLEQGYRPIVKKHLGTKQVKLVYGKKPNTVVELPVPADDVRRFVLTDDEILSLARFGVIIEKHYSDLAHEHMPMDIEWAKDGEDGTLYIIQARPETVHHATKKNYLIHYSYPSSEHAQKIITFGQSIGQAMVGGRARQVTIDTMESVKKGDILITQMTSPDWVPVMKRAAGIVTASGGRTCHAAIVSRELGIPAIVGVGDGIKNINDEQSITLDCSKGKRGLIYDGIVPFTKEKIEIATLPKSPVELLLNLAAPDRAYTLSFLPVSGVGLARIEFIIANKIKVHPMALVHPEKVTDAESKKKIAELCFGYESPQEFFIDRLAQGVGTIAAAFYPRPVIVRFSDFKSDEYRSLIGGTYFEPVEENPMIGFRGASRYYHELYRDAFALECAAMKRVREVMGLKNIKMMIPFVRDKKEAELVLGEMEKNGLARGVDGLEIFMMIEIPSDVLLIEQFCPLFDGFSIGSNDLTQMTLSIDRNSEILASMFDERSEAVKQMFELAIDGAHKFHKYIGVCGQAPSDYPDIAQFFIDKKIDSISLNADSIIPFLLKRRKFD